MLSAQGAWPTYVLEAIFGPVECDLIARITNSWHNYEPPTLALSIRRCMQFFLSKLIDHDGLGLAAGEQSWCDSKLHQVVSRCCSATGAGASGHPSCQDSKKACKGGKNWVQRKLPTKCRQVSMRLFDDYRHALHMLQTLTFCAWYCSSDMHIAYNDNCHLHAE
jgi:hypothetical protein